jgi:hypothetical protein
MQDINGVFTGTLLNHDRMPQTTPDLESSEWLRPWLPVAYPAPYLPTLRQIQDHPSMANIVLGAHQLVGQDKNGGLVPAGLFCGTQAPSKALVITNATIEGGTGTLLSTKAAQLVQGEKITIAGLTAVTALNGTFTVSSVGAGEFTVEVAAADHVAAAEAAGTASLVSAGQYCILSYSPFDIKFAYNAQTGVKVAAYGERAVLAVPSDAAVGDQVTLPSGMVVTITQNDINFASTCDLFDAGKVRPIGVAVRNVYQYIGGVLKDKNVSTTNSTTGLNYVLDGNVPVLFTILNYMHEMGTAIQTQFVLKLPWIGATPTTLTTLTAADGVTGYIQGIGRSFTHFTGGRGGANGQFSYGTAVVASNAGSGTDAGNYAPFNPSIHSPGDIVGRVIGIRNQNPVGFMNRVRTQFDRPGAGPMTDPNPMVGRMGGSATRGIPVSVNLTTDGAFIYATDQKKTLHPEYSTEIIVRVNL